MTTKTRVCEMCGSAALTQMKTQRAGNLKTNHFQCVNLCVGPKGWLETVWVEETPTETVHDLKSALQQALDEVAWLTKQNARLQAAESARLARWEEMAKTDEERAAEATVEATVEDSAAAADLYGGFDWSAVR